MVYLDHNASTPVLPEIPQAILYSSLIPAPLAWDYKPHFRLALSRVMQHKRIT